MLVLSELGYAGKEFSENKDCILENASDFIIFISSNFISHFLENILLRFWKEIKDTQFFASK